MCRPICIWMRPFGCCFAGKRETGMFLPWSWAAFGLDSPALCPDRLYSALTVQRFALTGFNAQIAPEVECSNWCMSPASHSDDQALLSVELLDIWLTRVLNLNSFVHALGNQNLACLRTALYYGLEALREAFQNDINSPT